MVLVPLLPNALANKVVLLEFLVITTYTRVNVVSCVAIFTPSDALNVIVPDSVVADCNG